MLFRRREFKKTEGWDHAKASTLLHSLKACAGGSALGSLQLSSICLLLLFCPITASHPSPAPQHTQDTWNQKYFSVYLHSLEYLLIHHEMFWGWNPSINIKFIYILYEPYTHNVNMILYKQIFLGSLILADIEFPTSMLTKLQISNFQAKDTNLYFRCCSKVFPLALKVKCHIFIPLVLVWFKLHIYH